MLKLLIVGDRHVRVEAQIQFVRELIKTTPGTSAIFVVDSLNCEKAVRDSGFELVALHRRAETVGTEIQAGGRAQKDNNRKKSLFHRVKKIVRNNLILFCAVHFIHCIWWLWRYEKVASALISKYRPDVIITNGDRGGFLEQAFLKAAKKARVATVLPYLVSSVSFNYRDLVVSRHGDEVLEHDPRSALPRLMRYIARQNVLLAEGKLYFFYDPGTALAYRLFGTMSKWPWQMGCGLIDIICVDNKMTCDLYRERGVPESKIAIIGDTALDSLHRSFCQGRQIRAAVAEKYGKDVHRKIIVCALPQFAEHGFMIWEKHWQEINYLVQCLCATGQNVLISLHPRMDRERYAYLETQYSCSILQEPLRDILPVADLFAVFYSSTVYWAPMCLVKTALVDFWDFRLDLFPLDSIRVFREKEGFQQELEKYLDEEVDFSRDEEKLSRAEIFDGNTNGRYAELIMSLVKNRAGEDNG